MYYQYQFQPTVAKIKQTVADVKSLIYPDFHKPSINQPRCISLALFEPY